MLAKQKTYSPDKLWWHQLPFPIDSLKIEKGQRPIGFRFSEHIANISADVFGLKLSVCGESDQPEMAMTKAIAELIERCEMIDHARRNHLSTFASNGWAAHRSRADAKRTAVFEIIERDAVLTQWYTKTPFRSLSVSELPMKVQTWHRKELSQSEYPHLHLLLSTEGLGPSVTCLLTNAMGFGVSGNATNLTVRESIDSAVSEACRAAHHSIRRAFWSDTLKLREPGHGPISCEPAAHALYYAYHEPFPVWMFGREITWSEANLNWRPELLLPDPSFSFALSRLAPLYVGQAKHARAISPFWGLPSLDHQRDISLNERIVKKTKNLNPKPHIVA